MILLYTDFGLTGPYAGQMKAAVLRDAPEGVAVVDLMHDAPVYNPRAAAYLLAALVPEFPPGSVFLCVVDPGVGTQRGAVAMEADGRWFVGPHNGLFNVVGMHAKALRWWEIQWRPTRLSATFHGRDLFAPVAARIAGGEIPVAQKQDPAAQLDPSWPAALREIIYIDHYGNAMTGIPAAGISADALLSIGRYTLRHARTFGDVDPGRPFWYANSIGLVEVAVNQGSAAEVLDLKAGTPLQL